MSDAVIPTPEQDRILRDGAAVEQLRASPGYAELCKILDEAVRAGILAMLAAKGHDELLETRGFVRGLMSITEQLDGCVHQAAQVSASFRAEVEAAKERERAGLEQTYERGFRASTRAPLA